MAVRGIGIDVVQVDRIKGSLEPPPAAKADGAAKADSGQGKKEGDAPKPHRDFLLDGLIR